jgi:hypothetical protein
LREVAIVSGAWRFIQRRVAFFERYDCGVVRKWEELSKAPDATAIVRLEGSTAPAPKISQ